MVYCDNEAVVHMVNNMASSCQQCQKLIWILTLDGIRVNRRLFTRYIATGLNLLADSLSRQNLKKFWKFAPDSLKETPDSISKFVWPAEKVWFNDDMNLFEF